MAVELSAFTGIVAPDQTTIDYVKGRNYAPTGEQWQQALSAWQQMHSDDGAQFDKEIVINCADIAPTVTWGTSPQHASAINSHVPNPNDMTDGHDRESTLKALSYQGLQAEQSISDIAIDAAFLGSCTNSRISDLRAAAELVAGHTIAATVKGVVVPGSRNVKRQAEAEGLDKIFTQAGFEWRDSGCSMCFFAGGETFGAGKRVISSTNRNFEGRQGPGTRTHLASPLTVIASAITGHITDPRELLESTQSATLSQETA
jgi:3-isopropylmalate/(R)-2-methylmalate dehydratase large subunit